VGAAIIVRAPSKSLKMVGTSEENPALEEGAPRMKSDLDGLLAAESLDALLVVGPAQNNAPMVYLTGGAHVTQAYLVKKAGGEPVLFHVAMERDEAARTGLRSHNLGNYPVPAIMKRTGKGELEATADLLEEVLAIAGVTSGRIAVIGKMDAGESYALFSLLGEALPGLELVGQLEKESVLWRARATKDAGEVERIRRMGEVTVAVVARTAEFLSGHQVRQGKLVRGDGEYLTVGDVKAKINLWLAERGVENPEGTIFAIGRDAGVPHSQGNAQDPLTVGRTIVFDIYPQEAGGGYFYDFTRTWCLSHAPDEVQSVYEDVRSVYEQILSELAVDTSCAHWQDRASELLEARGHPTLRSDPQTQQGYVHGLGHGLGLQVHEAPSLSTNAAETDRLEAGVVVTIEPGLYYPDQGMGVRLEDTVYVDPNVGPVVLADFPYDLVLPVRG
jgi:Xaa-Pro aminopeptidase